MNEPEIVKTLREEEKKGLLKSDTASYKSSQETAKKIESNLLDLIENSDNNILDSIKIKDFEESYKKIFENYFVGITIADEKERIISWNKYTEKLLGMTEKDLFLRNVSTLYPPDSWDEIRSENIRQKGMKYKMETKMLRKNGEEIDVELSLCMLKGARGKPIGSIGIINDISQKKKIKNDLDLKQDLLETLLNNIPDCIYFKDKKSRYIKTNKAKAERTNNKQSEIIGKTDFDLYNKEEAEINYKDDQKVLKKGKTIINKVQQITDSIGNKHWVSVTKIPRYNKKGNIIGLMGIDREITNIKESETKYKNLFETAMDPIIILDNTGRFVDLNNKVSEILGYNRKDLINNKFYETNILSDEYKKKSMKNFKKRIKGENVAPYELEVISKKGEIIPAEINGSTIIENNKVVGEIIIIRDLRDRYKSKKIAKELTESEKKFRDIFNATSDFLIYLENEIILDINNAALEILDIDKEEIIGKKISNLKNIFRKEDIEKHLDSIKNASLGKKVSDYKTQILTKKENQYQYLFSIDSIRYNDQIKGLIIRGRDITQRQRAWNELVRLEERYRVLAETSADGVITIDPMGRLTYVNPSFEKMLKRRKSKILATLFRDYLSDDSVYFFQQLFLDTRKKEEKIENVELELALPENEIMPIEVNMSPVEKNGKFSGIVCTIRDITERRKVEDELKKSERLKTEFMNIAAHELKSPVTPIKGYLDLIISDEKTSEHIKKWAKVSLRNAERLLRLVNDILDVSRLDTDTMRFDMEKLDTLKIINEIVEDMKPAVKKKGLKFKAEISDDLPNIMGDRYRLSQVLKNLFVNSIKFTDNGHIGIKAFKEKDNIHIIVEDTGIGISKNEVKKVFNKFYQAYTGDDRKNEGTGLGLFICKEIIKKHNGDIWVESKIRRGSTFHIKLPYIHKMVVDMKK